MYCIKLLWDERDENLLGGRAECRGGLRSGEGRRGRSGEGLGRGRLGERRVRGRSGGRGDIIEG